MVLDFHGTHRSLQEVSTMLQVLRALNMYRLDQVPTSNDPVIVRKNADKVRDLMPCVGAKVRQVGSLICVICRQVIFRSCMKQEIDARTTRYCGGTRA
jgi:hypothetical protein